ncbi:MAG TPA: hypothetical protein DDW20_01995 [Firmicutes bacterium]|nr:hypothetical protein [Bacillota bacterium]
MKCEKCGFDNIDNAKYCINCGTRLDGKILCPKCGTPLDKNAEKCPNCAYKVPHKSEEKFTGYTKAVNKLDNIFTKVFLVSIIVLLSISLFAVLGKYINISNTSNNVDQSFGFSYYFLVTNWIKFANIVSKLDMNNVGYFISILFETIVPFVLVLGNIILTYIFGIKGIISASKALKTNDKVPSYRYFIIVFISNLFAVSSLMGIQHLNGSSLTYFEKSSFMNSFLSMCSLLLFLMVSFECVKAFDKNKISLFMEKILSALSIIFVVYLIDNLHSSTLILNYTYENNAYYISYNSCSLLLNIISSLNTSTTISNNDIVLFVFLGINLILTLFIYGSLCVYAVFFGSGYFRDNSNSHKYKIPLYAGAFMSELFMTIKMFIIVTISIVLNSKLPEGYTFSVLPYTWSSFVIGLLLLGTTVASCVIIRSYRNYERIANQTTPNPSSGDVEK